jgi:hypothetical protein
MTRPWEGGSAFLRAGAFVWVANYYFSPENKGLGVLAPEGALPSAFPP